MAASKLLQLANVQSVNLEISVANQRKSFFRKKQNRRWMAVWRLVCFICTQKEKREETFETQCSDAIARDNLLLHRGGTPLQDPVSMQRRLVASGGYKL